MDWSRITLTPPAADEPELTVFGRGFGEALVAHLGGGHWVLVDSCRDPSTKRPIGIDYLRALGLDPALCVRYVVASHWHDDHIDGFVEAVRTCANAKWVASLAIQCDEFISVLRAYKQCTSSVWGSGTDSFRECLENWPDRLKLVGENTMLPLPHGSVIKLGALSPTTAAQLNAKASLGRLFRNTTNAGRRTIPAPRPNDSSIVLLADHPSFPFLMGSDMENNKAGWQEIAAAFVGSKSCVYKVAHHGSITGDHPDIWVQMVTTKPLSLMTPFRRGRVALPSEDDTKRMRAHGGHGYTATHIPRRCVSRPPLVQSAVANAGIRTRPAVGEIGLLRVRLSRTSPVVELSGGARQLW